MCKLTRKSFTSKRWLAPIPLIALIASDQCKMPLSSHSALGRRYCIRLLIVQSPWLCLTTHAFFILYLAGQRNQMIITIFCTNSTVSDHVIRYYIVLICYILQGGSFLCALLMFYLLRKMHGVGMQEKRARGVVSSARWSHGRPMDWDGLEDSQAFWATSGRNTYLCVASHSLSLRFFNATMHFAL